MDRSLKEELVQTMHRIKKVGMSRSTGFDIHRGDLIVMQAIAENSSHPETSVYVSDIQSKLYITKPAVSQILNALEKKGYVSREIDKNDRRKIAVTLTPKGQEILKQMRADADQMLETVISRLGEENTRQMIRLFTLMADISEDLKREEELKANEKGGDIFD
jgi:DNA-binding MarR family transcriptional regulator